jgi:hypothetical protein
MPTFLSDSFRFRWHFLVALLFVVLLSLFAVSVADMLHNLAYFQFFFINLKGMVAHLCLLLFVSILPNLLL